MFSPSVHVGTKPILISQILDGHIFSCYKLYNSRHYLIHNGGLFLINFAANFTTGTLYVPGTLKSLQQN